MPVQPSPSPSRFWEWTPESQVVYEWAITRLMARGVTRTVADIGCGSGTGTAMLRDAGFKVIGIEMDPDAVAVPGVKIERKAYRRDDIRRRDVYAATVIIGILGWYGHERNILETAMRDSGHVLANTIYPESWFAWMKGTPVFSTLPDGQKVMEWAL